MKFHVVSLFPEVISQYFSTGVVGRALSHEQFQLELHNPRDYTTDVHKTVDDKPFGGSAGMLMMAEPLSACMDEILTNDPESYKVFLSPKGRLWRQSDCQSWIQEKKSITLVCGRYEGVDQRWLNQYIDEEISVGDYVLSGGELPALILMDSVVRWLPGVLGNENSKDVESFQKNLLEPPQFTRPAQWRGQGVPEVLRSGHHKKIQSWWEALSFVETCLKRPDMLLMGPDQGKIMASLKKALQMSDEELKSCGYSRESLESALSQLDSK